MLNKPIVCTDFTGARDQIITGQTGSIVCFHAAEIAQAIEDLIIDKEKRDEYIMNLANSNKSCSYDFEQIIMYFA